MIIRRLCATSLRSIRRAVVAYTVLCLRIGISLDVATGAVGLAWPCAALRDSYVVCETPWCVYDMVCIRDVPIPVQTARA